MSAIICIPVLFGHPVLIILQHITSVSGIFLSLILTNVYANMLPGFILDILDHESGHVAAS